MIDRGESFLSRLEAGKRELGRLLARQIPLSKSHSATMLQQNSYSHSESRRSFTDDGEYESDVKRSRYSINSSSSTEMKRFLLTDSNFSNFL